MTKKIDHLILTKKKCGCIINEWDDGMIRKDYCDIHAKISDWHDRLEKGLSHSSTHLFKELIDVYKEMEKYLE